MTKCDRCGKELSEADARWCEYCKAKVFCPACAEAGALRIDDEIGSWMCDECVEKTRDIPNMHPA